MNACDAIITRNLSVWQHTLTNAAEGHRAMGGKGAVREANEIVAKALERAAAELDEAANARAMSAAVNQRERLAIDLADRVKVLEAQIELGAPVARAVAERADRAEADYRDALGLIRRCAKALVEDRLDDVRMMIAEWGTAPPIRHKQALAERDVLDAMKAFTDDDLRASVKASRECPADYPQYRETQLSLGVCSAELRRRGLEP